MRARRLGCMLGFVLTLCALCSAGQEGAVSLGRAPWLDRPMPRFVVPTPDVHEHEIMVVFPDLVRLARIPASLECFEVGGEDLPSLHLRLEAPTPRQVLAEFVAQLAPARRVSSLSVGQALCLVETDLLTDPAYPLNARDVQGFRVDGVSFQEVCERAAAAIERAASPGDTERSRWSRTDEEFPRARLGPAALPWQEPVTAEIRSGTAREVLWHVATLQPRCFWCVVATRGADDARGWCLVFSNWSKRYDESSDQLITALLADPIPDGPEPWIVAGETLNILRSRGAPAAEAVVAAYRAATSRDRSTHCLTILESLAVWPDAAAVVHRFAAREPRPADDPELARWLEDVARDTSRTAEGEEPLQASGPLSRWRLLWIVAVALGVSVLVLLLFLLRR